MKHFTAYFSVLFFYFFRWILLNPLPRPGEGYIMILQKCQPHFSILILILLFLFQEFYFLFFPAFPCFYIFFIFFFLVSRFFILFCLPFPVRFPSMLPYSVQFLYSFPFSILLLISSQVPFILLGWFFKTPYKPFAGPYRALKRLKA